MILQRSAWRGLLVAIGLALSPPLLTSPAVAQAPARKPNILVIMGDDVGWFNVGAYHRGMMSGKTPNLDKLASAHTHHVPVEMLFEAVGVEPHAHDRRSLRRIAREKRRPVEDLIREIDQAIAKTRRAPAVPQKNPTDRVP